MYRVKRTARWVVLGAVVGVLAGLSSALFLVTLEWATETRVAHGWLIYLLPLAGLGIGLAYHHLGGRAGGGNTLILDEIHEPTEWVPRRMAPLVFVGTVVTHLFGGSAGREGTAIQMSGSLTDHASRLLRLEGDDRRTMLVAAIAGGFGAVFGVPWAGWVFGLEVRTGGRPRWAATVPAGVAAVIGNLVVRGLGVEHTMLARPRMEVNAELLAKVALAGVAFGLAARAFTALTHGLRNTFRKVGWAPARPVIGAGIILAMTAIAGTRDYLGLSVPLATTAVAGAGVAAGAFAWKLAFTSVTLGSGFQGGEVTPLFVIGATLGASMGAWLGAPTGVLAAVGFVAVFAGAANTPLACTVMGIELFGWSAGLPVALACTIAWLCSARHGIYGPTPTLDRSWRGGGQRER